VLAVLVLAALTLVTIDARSNGSGVTSEIRNKVHDVFSPLQRATHAALQPIGNFLTGALDYGSLRRENQQLRNQVIALQNQSAQASAESAAAAQVAQQQGLQWVGSIPTRTVQIIDNGSSNFENTVTINKGTTSGLAAGQPVVAAGGLVGIIASAGARTSVVTLLTDPTFSVGVRLDDKNVGYAQGFGRNEPMHVSVITTNAVVPNVKKGQILLTSGLDSERYPPYIPVGKVIDASRAPGSVEPDITLQPLVDLDGLTYLQVLLWAPR
jgi:rod shape-determining protein MreC